MTILPSLITGWVNRAPQVAASRVLVSISYHLGVVSSSQAQPPASIASMLLSRILPGGSESDAPGFVAGWVGRVEADEALEQFYGTLIGH